MAIHLEQQKYVAILGRDGRIHLSGVLDESSDLEQTTRLIEERHREAPAEPIQLDFTHLVSGSWNGFLNLDRLLEQLRLAYVLRHVSLDLFRYVALLPCLRRARLGEIELAVVSRMPSQAKVQISGDEPVALSQSGRFALVRGQQIVGRHSFLFGGQVEARHDSQSKTEFDVWYDYIAFASITLALAEDLARSIAMSVIRLANELATEYEAQVKAMKTLKNTDKSVWALQAENEAKILAERAGDTESVYGQIILGIKKNVELVESMQKALQAAEADGRETQIKAIEPVRALRLSLLEIVQWIENGGTEAFALLISIPGKKIFDDAYHAAATPNAAGLAAIQKAFGFQDGTWDATKQAICQRTHEIELLVSNLIVLTQGFDLLRQIIEHRIAEIEEIENYLNQGAKAADFDSFKTHLHERIKRKLVTDQEKRSVDAVIPDVMEQGREEAHKPGEILLF